MAESRKDPSDKLYLMIAASLGVLTVVSYVADFMKLPKPTLVAVVLTVAVIKASLVATFFMHLNFDWTKVKVMLIPAAILAAVLVFTLMPDITIATRGSATWSPNPPKPPAPAEAAHQ